MSTRSRRALAAVFSLCPLFSFLAGAESAGAETLLVPAGAVWKYLDDGSNQGTAWRAPSFDDASWPSGPAELGYGDGDEATVVGYGPNPSAKYITTYFRHVFSVADPSAFRVVRMRLVRDDGAVVYLNGVEVARANMGASGPVYTTVALRDAVGAEEDRFFDFYAEPGALIAGSNVLAAEVHQRSAASSDISFALELAGLETVPHPIRKAPYLIYEGTDTAMRVLWQLALADTCTIEWGDDPTYAIGSAATYEIGTSHQHSHVITGLDPGAVYHYRVIAGEDTCTGSFRAAPPDDATTTRFFAYGDSRTFPAVHDSVAEGMVQAIAGDPLWRTLVLSVGDLATDGNVEDCWQIEHFDRSYPGLQAMLGSLPFQACMGNHEMAGLLFAKYFPYPFAGGRYWSFDYGPAHFTVIDQYTAYGPGSPQLAWIEADLASTTKPWRFVLLHEPGWSAGGGHENDPDVQTYLQPLFAAHDVSIVFAGHNHYYARAEVEGVEHVTTGGGGANLHTPNPAYPNVVQTARAYHYCTVEIDGGRLRFRALAPEGTLLDSLTLLAPTGVAGGAGAAPARVPVLEAAYPNPFNPSVAIRLSLPEAAHLRLAVHDPGGRRVAVLADSYRDAGEATFRWDGLDERGRLAASGVYLVRLEAGPFRTSRKIVLLR